MKDEDSHPIFFEGTDPRRRGFPLPKDESDVGKPREQFERALRTCDAKTRGVPRRRGIAILRRKCGTSWSDVVKGGEGGRGGKRVGGWGCGRAGVAVATHVRKCVRKIFPGIQNFRETFAKVGCRSAKV